MSYKLKFLPTGWKPVPTPHGQIAWGTNTRFAPTTARQNNRTGDEHKVRPYVAWHNRTANPYWVKSFGRNMAPQGFATMEPAWRRVAKNRMGRVANPPPRKDLTQQWLGLDPTVPPLRLTFSCFLRIRDEPFRVWRGTTGSPSYESAFSK